jgi:hypothetical protein
MCLIIYLNYKYKQGKLSLLSIYGQLHMYNRM